LLNEHHRLWERAIDAPKCHAGLVETVSDSLASLRRWLVTSNNSLENNANSTLSLTDAVDSGLNSIGYPLVTKILVSRCF
jgi:hypothetical protein